MSQTQTEKAEEAYYLEGYWKHGRYYGSHGSAKWPFPIDSEELSRQDIYHKVFLIARDGLVFHHPLPKDRDGKMIDLGTGTAIYPIHMTEEYPKLEVQCVDINKVQPPLIPRLMSTQQLDLEEPSWGPLLWNCDYIHARLLYGGIRADLWPRVYRNIYEHLAPGGFMEHIEIDWTPHWENDEIPNPSSLKEWSELFLAGLDRAGRSARIDSPRTKKQLEDAGFVDVKEEAVRFYVNPWSNERKERETARWFNLVLAQGLEAMSWVPLIDHGSMEFDQVRELCGRVQKEICILRFHAYVTAYIWSGKRPHSNSR